MQARCLQIRAQVHTVRAKQVAAVVRSHAPYRDNVVQERKPRSNLPNLEAWQQSQLESAFLAGRRRIQVSKLSAELGLSRDDVLSWLKHMRTMPDDVRESILTTHSQSQEFDQELKEHIAEVREKKQQRRHCRRQARRPEHTEEEPSQRPLTRIQEAALIKLSSTTLRPTNEEIEYTLPCVTQLDRECLRSFYTIYKLPRTRVVEWFTEQRRKRGKRRSKR